MSSSIWTQCGGASSSRRLTSSPWRAVEAQHVISTRQLTDSDAEQGVLEELIERSKPPSGDDTRGLHFLLFTPFRYPPLPHGSRFGSRAERGIWYGSETLRACFAEVAYYRMVFLEGTQAEIAPLFVELTTFRADVRSARGVDLMGPAFDAHAGRISSPTSYGDSQQLGRTMREDGVEVARYRSARDKEGGANLAVFSPAAFARRKPRDLQTWICVAGTQAVEVSKRNLLQRSRPSLSFPRSDFEVKGVLPSPAT